MPGHYRLPFDEGKFVISNNNDDEFGRVVMTTRGSGVPYEHPLVEVVDPVNIYEYGWYSHFMHSCNTNDLQIKGVYVPKFKFDGY